ncbi:hypothetical protein EI94DRAFT_1798901 [Lactarius quietus]|nr:hypothetical protein EI94DRAFT_1798901 [Lactarius quietus]
MNDTQILLIDGYISQTFRSRAAERFFLNLLKTASIPPDATLPCTWREGHFLIVYSVPPHLNPPGRLVLDRSVVGRGTVVPQTLWTPKSAIDRRRHVEKANLEIPVFFEDNDGGLGVSLGASIDGQCRVLRDANDPAPLGQKTTTHIRIVWPGYKEFKRQIPIRDESRAAIPSQRLVVTFLQVCELDSRSVDDRSQLWRIGPGGIQHSDIVIIGAVHVSVGSWMPILQLNRYVF